MLIDTMMTIIQYLSKFVGLYDSKTSRIIMPTMNLLETVSVSSTYRIIGLYKLGLLLVAKNNIGGKSRKVFTEAE